MPNKECMCGHDVSYHDRRGAGGTTGGPCSSYDCACPTFTQVMIVPDDDEPQPAVSAPARSRFAAVAEEMDLENWKAVSVPPGAPTATVTIVFDPSGRQLLTCTLCGGGAFTPREGRQVICMGCPPPPPLSPLPEGVTLTLSRYRCGSCGKQEQVTMTLSDVNLHCSGCRRLTLHAKQSEVTPSFSKAAKKSSLQFLGTKVVPTLDIKVDPAFGPTWSDLATPGVTGEIASAWAAQVEALRVRLAFEPFAAFAQSVIDSNRKIPGISAQAWGRRSGRSTKGLIEAIAWCIILKKPRLHVRSATVEHDRWLTKEANALAVAADVEYPSIIKASDRSRTSEGKIPPDVQLYVDHHWFEVDAKVGRPQIDQVVAPNGRKFWTCGRCGYRREVPFGSDATFPQCSKCGPA